jgi:predicted NAD/FAD-binding protein
MRIAIIGTGIAGMTAAWLLQRQAGEHDITVYESEPRIGGHTNTVSVAHGGRTWAVDTGFIVCNDWTYPNFLALMKTLGVALQPTTMSFSMRDEGSGIEYGGSTINSLYAQRGNFFSWSFQRMVREILRFNREAVELLQAEDADPLAEIPLADYLASRGYHQEFIDHYLVPMGGAIWSSSRAAMLRFPARFLVRFMHNHGMLSVNARPQWRVVTGGSRTYAEALTRPFRERIRTAQPVLGVSRQDGQAWVRTSAGSEGYDALVMACHADTALRLIDQPSAAERDILRCFPYQENLAVLHTDESFMPRSRRAWSAWNHHVPVDRERAVAVTYDMNALQGLDADCRFLVTLNPHREVRGAVLKSQVYEHPLFTPESPAAQRRHGQINGVDRLYFAGAYWGYGFHEDGVRSALAAVKPLTASTITSPAAVPR